jgi:hypothetical protein
MLSTVLTVYDCQLVSRAIVEKAANAVQVIAFFNFREIFSKE